MPASRRYKVHPYRINTHGDRPPFCQWSFVSTDPELDSRFLHNRSTDFDSVTWTSLGSTPATHRYKEGSEVPIFHVAIWSRGRQEGGGDSMSCILEE